MKKFQREVDVDKMHMVEDYVDKNEDLATYVKANGFKINDNVMSCPFHGSDSTPSLRVSGNQWKCFGCGRGGRYLAFLFEMAKLENSKATYYDTIEKYIQEHKELIATTGGTVYKSHEESQEEAWENMLEIATQETYKPLYKKTQSYDNLIRKAKKQDIEVQMRLLAGIQNELPYPVLENIVMGTDLTGKTLLELSMG